MDADKRKARVRRLKREIMVILLILISVPWIFVIVFAVKNNSLKKLIATKDNMISEYSEKLSKALNDTASVTADSNSNETETVVKPFKYEGLTEEQIEALKLSDEELYDGYRKVYLTFDDGPSTNTAAILDVLKQYNVKATFFVIYKEGEDNEALYKRIVDEGHTLGMHSRSHVYSKVYGSEEMFLEDTTSLRDYLYNITGVESTFYRFPGGSSNKASDIDMRVFGKILKEQGITYFDWNMASGDAHSPILSADEIIENSTKDLETFSQVVLLFHDTASKTTTVEALPKIIEYVQSLEYTVILPISDETIPVQHVKLEE